MLYEKMKLADKNRDIDAFMELVHDDFVFVRNQNGTDVDRTGFYEGRKMMYASDKVTREPPVSGMLSAALFISNFQVGGIGM
jgi:hypothetical protein